MLQSKWVTGWSRRQYKIFQGECAIDDAELVRMKNTFTEGLEYLRNFQVRLFEQSLRKNFHFSQTPMSSSTENFDSLLVTMLRNFQPRSQHLESFVFLFHSSLEGISYQDKTLPTSFLLFQVLATGAIIPPKTFPSSTRKWQLSCEIRRKKQFERARIRKNDFEAQVCYRETVELTIDARLEAVDQL